MKIEFVEIRNFRKLKSCRIEISDDQTIFVGANNSGKTSAMDALILFLKKSRYKYIATTDFTLSNWSCINEIGDKWVNAAPERVDLTIDSWIPHLPSMDVWLNVTDKQIHHVSHLIPTLSWQGGLLGVRLRFEPKDIEDLYKEFILSLEAAKKTLKNPGVSKLKLWPQSMKEFLDKRLHQHFVMKSYLLDPQKLNRSTEGVFNIQELPPDSIPLDSDPFDGLIKIDIINAERGFSNVNTSAGPNRGSSTGGLSTQLRQYFSSHLDPADIPDTEDIDALEAIETARTTFDNKLRESFKPSLTELERLGYPGFSDPEIILTSKINPIDGLNHDTAVQFRVLKNDQSLESHLFCLPEKYNGLGYQNLVSMVFNLIRFRDEWMRKGNIAKKQEVNDTIIEPLHLVLIEEPEAHLHAQVQQVFIKKAYGVLRNHSALREDTKFRTQLVVSTHSSHIAHEIDFSNLKYFRRQPAQKINEVPCANVVNLSNTFGKGDETSKFVTRYLKTTHCDLFFADAAIIVEGAAERMFIPHFIKYKYPELDSRYITVLEIGGSHAHRLRPLIENLGIQTLVITDLDAKDGRNKKRPQRGLGYKTGNTTLKKWIPCKEKLDQLLDAKECDKVSSNSLIRVAYQSPFKITFKGSCHEVLPYTFEDALLLTNISLFQNLQISSGMLKEMTEALNKDIFEDVCQTMFEVLDGGKKAEMALDVLYMGDIELLDPPLYIKEGLEWLLKELNIRNQDFIAINVNPN